MGDNMNLHPQRIIPIKMISCPYVFSGVSFGAVLKNMFLKEMDDIVSCSDNSAGTGFALRNFCLA